jgi:predicted membrane protein
MKKTHLIFSLILLLGFFLECMFYFSTSIFLDAKIWLLGVICIIVGALGLWVTALLPFINKRLDKRKT